MLYGKIRHWEAEKGWGFIGSEHGGGSGVFVHVSAFRPHTTAVELRKGLFVTYELGEAKRGGHKEQAVNVRLQSDDDDNRITTIGGEV